MNERNENFEDLKGGFSATYSETNHPPRHTMHLHDAYEIMLVLSNDVWVDVNNESYPVPYGSILLFNVLDLHKICNQGSGLYKRFVIWFKNDFLNQVEPLRNSLLKCFYSRGFEKANLISSKEHDLRFIKEKIEELANRNYSGEMGSILQKLHLAELLTLINELYFSNKSQPNGFEFSSDVYKAILYIQQNYFEEICQDKLARIALTDRRTLCEEFKKITGMSTGQYILNCRLTAAKAFLVQGYSVSETAEKTGFGNFSNFSRTFKNHVGISPKRYAIEHRI